MTTDMPSQADVKAFDARVNDCLDRLRAALHLSMHHMESDLARALSAEAIMHTMMTADRELLVGMLSEALVKLELLESYGTDACAT